MKACKRIWIVVLCAAFLAAPLASCNEEPEKGTGPVAEITMESGGVIEIMLDKDAAPVTVENFVSLASDGFYDGLTFHYIMSEGLIQGGDPEGTGMGGLPDKIKGEFSANGWDNPISFERGILGMARGRSDFDSASCQFFITLGDVSHFDTLYAGFGYVTGGMDVVDEIAAVETDASNKPLEPVTIQTIRIKE